MTDWALAKCLRRPDLDWDDPTGPDGETCARVCAHCPIRQACAAQRVKTAEYDRELTVCQRSRSCYVHGCRRRACVAAHRAYVQHWRARRATRPPAPIVLTRPYGRGRHRAWPGQLMLFTA